MVSPALPASPGAAPAPRPVDTGVAALAKALRERREEAQALVRLVEQTAATSDKGRHVNYYA